jgi:hypothetical protein
MILELLADENGKLSAARVLLVLSLAFTAVIITVDSFLLWATVPNAGYALMGTIFTGLLAWTAGPRIAKHLLPQIGAVASGIGAALTRGEPRRPELLDNDPAFRDDEK